MQSLGTLGDFFEREREGGAWDFCLVERLLLEDWEKVVAAGSAPKQKKPKEGHSHTYVDADEEEKATIPAA